MEQFGFVDISSQPDEVCTEDDIPSPPFLQLNEIPLNTSRQSQFVYKAEKHNNYFSLLMQVNVPCENIRKE